MSRTKLLNTLTTGYEQVAVIFPIVVAAPRYFSGAIQLGGLMQTVGAFAQVQSALSWFVTHTPIGELARDRRTSDHLPQAIVAAREAVGREGMAVTRRRMARCGRRT